MSKCKIYKSHIWRLATKKNPKKFQYGLLFGGI